MLLLFFILSIWRINTLFLSSHSSCIWSVSHLIQIRWSHLWRSHIVLIWLTHLSWLLIHIHIIIYHSSSWMTTHKISAIRITIVYLWWWLLPHLISRGVLYFTHCNTTSCSHIWIRINWGWLLSPFSGRAPFYRTFGSITASCTTWNFLLLRILLICPSTWWTSSHFTSWLSYKILLVFFLIFFSHCSSPLCKRPNGQWPWHDMTNSLVGIMNVRPQ